MNLSVKTTMRQLAVLAVASFFFSCQDETSLLGYKNPTTKFNIAYVDIPVETSVLLLDSIRTSNYDASNDFNRLLVGQLEDPKFGNVTASAFTQFFPLGRLVKDDSLVYDSLVMDLRVDYYVYGKDGVTTQQLDIYKVTESLGYRDSLITETPTGGQQKPSKTKRYFKKLYFNKSTASYDPSPLGSKSFSVDFAKYNQEIVDATPDKLDVSVRLDNAYGQELFTTMSDTAVFIKALDKDFSVFFPKFQGVAIVPQGGDKIIGFKNDSTRLRLHYHILKGNGTTKSSQQLNFTVSRSGVMTSFSAITSDRSVSELAGLTNFYEDFQPANDQRYIQAGTGIVTKLDFSKFKEFADTTTYMVINSAEFVIKDIEAPGYFAPPPNLLVKLLDDNNRPKKLTYPGKNSAYTSDLNNINLYQGYINFDAANTSTFFSASTVFDSTINIINDVRGFFTLNYSSDNKTYRGTASLFFQQLFVEDENKTRFTKALLIPYAPAQSSSDPTYGRHVLGKMLNRVAFNKNNIVLRVYYTIPTVHSTQ
jgi:hypothetical protein